MIKKLFLFSCIFYSFTFLSCTTDDGGDSGTITFYKTENQSDFDLRYKEYEDANDSFFLNIPANNTVEIASNGALGTITLAPNLYFEFLKLRNNENTIVYEQNPIENDSWNLDNKTYTLTITSDLLD